MARDHGMAQLMKNHRRKNQSDENQTVQAPNADNFVSDKVDNEKQEQEGNMNLEWYSQDGTDLKRPFHRFCLLESKFLLGLSGELDGNSALPQKKVKKKSPPVPSRTRTHQHN
jgi:hypothetical protein